MTLINNTDLPIGAVVTHTSMFLTNDQMRQVSEMKAQYQAGTRNGSDLKIPSNLLYELRGATNGDTHRFLQHSKSCFKKIITKFEEYDPRGTYGYRMKTGEVVHRVCAELLPAVITQKAVLLASQGKAVNVVNLKNAFAQGNEPELDGGKYYVPEGHIELALAHGVRFSLRVRPPLSKRPLLTRSLLISRPCSSTIL